MYHVYLNGIIEKYKNATFKEYIITHDTNNPTRDEEGDTFFIGEDAGRSGQTVKREIIYVKK